MARPLAAGTSGRLATAALAGAATGATLVAAEVAASLLLAAPLPPRAWAFVAAYCVPAFALAGALAATLLPLPRVVAALVWLTCALYCATVSSQDLLDGRPRWAPIRIAALLVTALAFAAAAAVTERVVARRALRLEPALVLRMALLVPVACALQVLARALHGTGGPAALAVPIAAAAAGGLAAIALAPVAARASARQAAGAAAAAAAIIALSAAWWMGRPAPGSLRDDPQAEAPRAAAALPSVVLVVLDTVRAANLSCYGYERKTTPHLDAFAAGAVRFTAASTVSPWSVPAHASLFTGLFAPEHGAGTAPRGAGTTPPGMDAVPLDGRFETLAEGLAARGYATAGISANVLVAPHTNLAQGFRYYDVRLSPRALSPHYRTLLQRVQGLLPPGLLADPLLAAFPRVYRSAEEITDAARSWLARRPAGQPYLLFLNYMDAHTPFAHRPGFSGRWPGRSPRLPGYGVPGTQGVMARRRALTGEEAAHLRALYDDALSYLDHHLGRLFQALDAQPDRDRTWLVVTADHGESLGEHHQLGHDCVLSEHVLRVPLLMRYPRAAPEAARHGGVDERPAQITDLAPAILAAAGGPAPRDAPSRHGVRVASVDCFCWRYHPEFHGPAAQAVVIGPLKHLHEQGRPPALFDLAADPLEQRDLTAVRPDDARRLAAELERWRAGLAAAPPATAAADAAREEALRALGYVR